MNADLLGKALYHQKFAVEVSKRYHAHRIDGVARLRGFLQAVELVASTAALISTFAWSLTVTRGLILVAGLSAGLSCVKKLHDAMAWHYAKKAEYGELLMRFPVDEDAGTVELLEEIVKRRGEIEKDDTGGFECLDIFLHNEVCRAWGNEDGTTPMTWWQEHAGLMLPIKYRPPRGGV